MSFAERHPIIAFLLLMYPLAWLLAAAAFLLHLPTEPAIAGANLLGVLGPAVLITYRTGGRPAVRRLFSGLLRWRVGFGWYGFALLAMPLVTVPVSIATGTLPDRGWAGMALTYLLLVAVGAVGTNFWEEVAWSGLVQSRLTAHRGLLVGAVATGPLFAAQHLPIVVANGGGIAQMVILFAVLAILCIFFRYVVGSVLLDTGGSLLIVGILHASSDAAGSAFGDGWQHMVGTVSLAVLIFAYRAVRHRAVNPRRATAAVAA